MTCPEGTSAVYKRSYDLADEVIGVYIGHSGCVVARSASHDAKAGMDPTSPHYSRLKPGQTASVHVLAFVPEEGIKTVFRTTTKPGQGQDNLLALSTVQLARVGRQIVETVFIHYFGAAAMPPRFVALLSKFDVRALDLFGLNTESGLAMSAVGESGARLEPLPTPTEGLETGCPVLLRKFYDGRGVFSLNIASNYTPLFYLQRVQMLRFQEYAEPLFQIRFHLFLSEEEEIGRRLRKRLHRRLTEIPMSSGPFRPLSVWLRLGLSFDILCPILLTTMPAFSKNTVCWWKCRARVDCSSCQRSEVSEGSSSSLTV